MNYLHKKFFVGAVGFFLGFVFLFSPIFLVPARVFAASGGNVSGFAWSENIGWVSMNSSSDGSSITYGVNLDTSTGSFSGYGWSEHVGWIDFSGAHMNMATGKVTGTAQAVVAPADGWDGIIKMSDDTVSVWFNQGVQMDLTTGVFSGYAWGGGDTGPAAGVVGWLAFATSLSSVQGPVAGAPTVTLSASPTSVPDGGSSNLTWTSVNATNCTASGDWSGGITPGGPFTTSTGALALPGPYSYTLTCTGPGGSASATATVTINAPDLTAAPPTPATAVANTAQTYTATISNIGSASTGAGFSNFFQTNTKINGDPTGTFTDWPPSTMTTLTAGASNTATSPSITFAVGATPSIRACADKTSSAGGGVIPESNEGNNCSSWTNISVSSVALPDLIAAPLTPNTAVVGVGQVYSSVISNIGNTTTGASFGVIFQTATVLPVPPGIATDRSPYYTVATLAAGSSATAFSPVISIFAPGTYYLRACADQTSGGSTGVIPESNEANNCSPWTNINVTAGGASATLSLGAANCTIALNASTCTVPFTWNITGATTPDLFNATRSLEYSNQATCGLFCPVSYPITFGMNTVQARDGATVLASVFPTGICTSGSSWNGSICAAASPSATLSASPTSVTPNSKSTLTWTSANATSCTASGGSTGWPAAVTGANYTGSSWLTAPLPAGTYTYTLTCSKSGSPSAVVAATVTSGVAVCGNTICETGENLLNCPIDCKTKIEQF